MNEYRRLELERPAKSRKEDYKYFVGTTTKNPLTYKPFEKMVFRFRGKFMDDYLDIPCVSYTLISDDGQSAEGYLEPAEDGWFYLEASISRAGFVYIQAKACDANRQPIEGIAAFNASAGADVEGILRATPIPEDYDEVWDSLLCEVEETPPDLLFCESVESDPAFEAYDMRIRAPRGEYASVAVAYPKDAKPRSLKCVMIFQGYGVGPAKPKPMAGYLSIVVGAHCLPNGESKEFYADMRDGALKGYGFDAVENESVETSYWTRMLLRDMQALRCFRDHELLTGEGYYFVGSSQGGMQACNMAAHFDRSSAVILNVPWLSDIYGHELAGRRPARLPKGKGVVYFDTAIAAGYLKCPAYIISGLGDGTCIGATQMSLFNSIKSQKYIEFYQNKTHSLTIPWDRNMYSLGDASLADKFGEHTASYYAYN